MENRDWLIPRMLLPRCQTTLIMPSSTNRSSTSKSRTGRRPTTARPWAPCVRVINQFFSERTATFPDMLYFFPAHNLCTLDLKFGQIQSDSVRLQCLDFNLTAHESQRTRGKMGHTVLKFKISGASLCPTVFDTRDGWQIVTERGAREVHGGMYTFAS